MDHKTGSPEGFVVSAFRINCFTLVGPNAIVKNMMSQGLALTIDNYRTVIELCTTPHHLYEPPKVSGVP